MPSCSLGPGKCFGEFALLSEKNTRNASVIAEEDSELLVISRNLFNKSLKVRSCFWNLNLMFAIYFFALLYSYDLSDIYLSINQNESSEVKGFEFRSVCNSQEMVAVHFLTANRDKNIYTFLTYSSLRHCWAIPCGLTFGFSPSEFSPVSFSGAAAVGIWGTVPVHRRITALWILGSALPTVAGDECAEGNFPTERGHRATGSSAERPALHRQVGIQWLCFRVILRVRK